MLVGTSAFAETRHHDGTRGEGRVERSDRGDRGNRGGDRAERGERQRVEQPQQQQRNERSESFNRDQRSNGSWNRDNRGSSNNNWNRDNRGSSSNNNWNRNGGRSENFYRDSNRNSFNRGSSFRGRTPFFHSGRVSRYEPWNGGYRVWISGASYPFFVPLSYWRLHPFRIGLSINLGGYYNPLGYYDYYDGPYVSTPVARGEIRGVVESVDYRRGTLVVRDDNSGEFVTTVMRGRDRTFDSLRPGDYIELSGDWIRGTFEAYRADLLNDRYNDDYRR